MQVEQQQTAVMDDPALAEKFRKVVADYGITQIVETGAGNLGSTRCLASMAARVVAIEVWPEAVNEANRTREELCLLNVEVMPGHSPRVLKDIQFTLDDKTLYFLAANGLVDSPLRDEIFHIPRGQGVIAIQLSTPSGLLTYAEVQDQLIRWSPNHRIEYQRGEGGQLFLFAYPQRHVHVTFLIEKYTLDYGKSGISVNLDNLVATLHQSGLATYDIVHYDELYHEGKELTPELINRRPGMDEHMLVCTCHYHSETNPKAEVLRAVKESGTKVVFVWLDKKTSVSTPAYTNLADVNVLLDGNDFELPNSWPIFTPKNPQHFNDPGWDRDIDLSMVGDARYLAQRKSLFGQLEMETRIKATLFKSSAADKKLIRSLEDYTAIFKRSKISLALTQGRVKQLKGRIFEVIHCGAMLLCDINPYINTYLVAGKEYVPFVDYEDMIRKAEYYIEHDDERREIARAGNMKVTKYYSNAIFWRSLFARAGLISGGA